MNISKFKDSALESDFKGHSTTNYVFKKGSNCALVAQKYSIFYVFIDSQMYYIIEIFFNNNSYFIFLKVNINSCRVIFDCVIGHLKHKMFFE